MVKYIIILFLFINISFALEIDKKYIHDVKKCEKLYYTAISHTISSDISANYANMYLACMKKAETDLLLRIYKNRKAF